MACQSLKALKLFLLSSTDMDNIRRERQIVNENQTELPGQGFADPNSLPIAILEIPDLTSATNIGLVNS